MKLLGGRQYKSYGIYGAKEVARRMAAQPGGKDYGSLSVACSIIQSLK